MRNHIFTILVILATLGVAVYAFRWLQRESFVPAAGVRYMTAQETAQFLLLDQDGYAKNLSPTDLYARRASSSDQYVQRSAKTAMDFSPDQRIRFNKASQAADAFFQNNATAIDLTASKMVQIPWIFALTEGDTYEHGLPHTRGNVIFVSSYMNEQHRDLVRTLIHEKVHLYQRLYPEEITQILERRKFRRWKQRLGEPRVRANPDVDPWIYINPENNEPMVALYASDQPADISDIYLQDGAFEHPYEYLAYEIASLYK